jgi:hypothetical protein
MVSDAFFLSALLHDHDECNTSLILRNDVDHVTRLDLALRARNLAMVGPGQEQWNHICDRCCATKTVDGVTCTSTISKFIFLSLHTTLSDVMRAVVMDGVTVGRPCCGVHDCKGRLLSQRARFCTEHAHFSQQCCVVGCQTNAETGFMTCTLDSHRAVEQLHLSRRSALFQLQKRLEHLGRMQLSSEGLGMDADVDTLVADEVIEANEVDDECLDKPEQGNTKTRARFGRRWTHNEQLCVATCSVVLGRMTMYGSEAVNGARVSQSLLSFFQIQS